MIDLSNESVIHVRKGDIEYLQFRRLLEYENIVHAYTMKKNELNFRGYEEIWKNNCEKIAKELNIDVEQVIKPYQSHTDRVEKAEDVIQSLEKIDGIVTNKNKNMLVTTSADCTGLIFYEPFKKVVANVHSGWRGTVQKIGVEAVRKMVNEYDCRAGYIICCICPCIQKCHFEVEEDVKNIFEQTFSYTGKLDNMIFKGRVVEKDGIKVQKYNIDTTYINKTILQEAGLKPENIIDSNICTVCNSEYFYSYRANNKTEGRNAAIIGLK